MCGRECRMRRTSARPISPTRSPQPIGPASCAKGVTGFWTRWTASAPYRGLPTGLLGPLAAARHPNTGRRGMRRSGCVRRSSTGWWMGRLRAGVWLGGCDGCAWLLPSISGYRLPMPSGGKLWSLQATCDLPNGCK